MGNASQTTTTDFCVALTLEKQAPMWTLGVGGRPLDTGLGVVDDEGGGVGDDEGRFPDRSRLRRGGAFGDPSSAKDIRQTKSV